MIGILQLLKLFGLDLFESADLAFKLVEGDNINNLSGYCIIEKVKTDEIRELIY